MEQPPKRERQEFHRTHTTPSLNTQWPTLFTVDAVEKRTTISPYHGGTVLSTPPNTGQTQCALGLVIVAVSASDITNGREGQQTLVTAVPFNRVFGVHVGSVVVRVPFVNSNWKIWVDLRA